MVVVGFCLWPCQSHDIMPQLPILEGPDNPLLQQIIEDFIHAFKFIHLM